MSFLCTIRMSVFAVLYVVVSLFMYMIGFGLGRRSAIRKHWKMLARVGSRFSREDN